MALNLAENLIEDAWQLHHQLAERLVALSSRMLNAAITMECTNIERVRWSEFLGRVKEPTLLCLVRSYALAVQHAL